MAWKSLIFFVFADGFLNIHLRRSEKKARYGLLCRPIKNAPQFQDRHSLIFRSDTQTSKANRQLAREIEQILKAKS